MVTIPGYTISKVLHEGTKSVVYRALRDVDGLKVVLKSQSSPLPTARDIAKIRHEHEVLSALRGPGVPAVDALESVGHRVVLVMEDMGLSSLDLALALDEPLDLAFCLRIAAAVASILQRAHARRIVHQDIKPHNILARVGPPLSVYVIDWGSAAQLSERRSGEIDLVEPAHSQEATLAYIAPEQTGLLDRPIDARTDLYLLGATLYHMLTGVLPFTDEDPRALLYSHLTRTPEPPHRVDERIPAHVSGIVMRLLAKNPEDRYATARGLERDLTECAEQWEAHGEIAAFPLGRSDRSGELHLPEKLYGRDADVAAALSAFRRVLGGATEMLLVTGSGGVGKSALVRNVCSAMKLEGARFAQAKCEQYRGATPYTSLALLFRELLRQVMAERGGAIERWRTALQAALGQEAGAWTAMLPELERVLGPQPPAPELDPVQAQTRFHHFAQQFVSVFAGPERPLVLFLDDLQWAEPASLQVLERILTDPESAHLLVIGAYRDHDPDAIRLLSHALDRIAAEGVPLSRVVLGPLDSPDVFQLIADALGTTPAHAEPLGVEIHKKTRGTPFFVGQLLLALVQQGLLSFDGERGAWTWDLPAIAARAVADNVAELLVERLRRLDPSAQELLQLAACLGAEFEHDMLAEVAGQSVAMCARGLWGALVEGFVIPLHDDYRLLREAADTPGAHAGSVDAGSDLSAPVAYRFLHDRVQEAAHLLLEETQRARVHVRIARILLARRERRARDEQDLFTIVDHLNAGRTLLVESAERLTAARLSLEAGRRAHASVAYDAARAYLRQGIDYLPEDARDAAYELDLALRLAHAEAVSLCGEIALAESLLDALSGVVRSEMDWLQVRQVRLKVGNRSGKYAELVQIGREILSTLGAPLPETNEDCDRALPDARAAVANELSRRTEEEVAGMPPVTAPRGVIVAYTLFIMDAPAFTVYPPLSALISLRQVLTALEHGPSAVASIGFMAYGMSLLRTRGRCAEAESAIRIAELLCERYPTPEFAPRILNLRSSVANSIRPFTEAISLHEKSIELALRFGEVLVVGFGSHQVLVARFLAEEDVNALAARIEPLKKLLRRTKQARELRIMDLFRQLFRSLRGETLHPCSLSDPHFDEEAFRAAETSDIVLGFFYMMKAMLLCLHGDAAALSLLNEVVERSRQSSMTLYAQVCFHVCLLLCRLLDDASGADATRYRAMLDEHHAIVAQRRALCEENWRCHDLLIKAERARLNGSHEEAQLLYDEALTLAEQGGLPRMHALASELCGKHHAMRRHARIARLYLTSAYQGWLRWGAVARAAALKSQYPELVTPQAEAAPTTTRNVTTSSRNTSTIALQGVLYDLGQVMQAAYAISSEITADGVLEQFLQASSIAATVSRAFVVLIADGEATLAARFTLDPPAVMTAPRVPLAGTSEIPESIARYVASSREPVVLSAGADAGVFADDPYLKRHRAKLILSVPLLHRERLVGVWYAEGNSSSGLREGSMALLQLLASQAASALENAYLYAQLKAMADDLASVNRTLESQVAARTEELRDSHGRLLHEFEERARVERERISLQERVIQLQQETLLELSTPIIPIRDDVGVMPLIGAMDEQRAERMVATALTTVHARGIRVLIVDVTGLRDVDQTMAAALPRLASALGLVGARVVLTGVRAETAKVLVELDLNMSSIALKRTLQAGIAFAVGQDRGRVVQR
jgi:predicted ATPase/anti-anti-sigma regulatory factor/tRNA A-37 threonylcarbamoyl transferase component Bud32